MNKWPAAFEKIIISGTQCLVHLKPGCKFKFVSCLEIYKGILVNLDPEGTLECPFYSGSLKISLAVPIKSRFICVKNLKIQNVDFFFSRTDTL